MYLRCDAYFETMKQSGGFVGGIMLFNPTYLHIVVGGAEMR